MDHSLVNRIGTGLPTDGHSMVNSMVNNMLCLQGNTLGDGLVYYLEHSLGKMAVMADQVDHSLVNKIGTGLPTDGHSMVNSMVNSMLCLQGITLGDGLVYYLEHCLGKMEVMADQVDGLDHSLEEVAEEV